MTQSLIVNTNFAQGEKVYYRLRLPSKKVLVTCPTCEGHKIVHILKTMPDGARAEFELPCPDCGPSPTKPTGKKGILGPQRVVVRLGTIGKIEVSFYKAQPWYGRGRISSLLPQTPWGYMKISYMLVETGVGGGNVYDESSLYRTLKEAIADPSSCAHAPVFDAKEDSPENLHIYDLPDREGEVREIR